MLMTVPIDPAKSIFFFKLTILVYNNIPQLFLSLFDITFSFLDNQSRNLVSIFKSLLMPSISLGLTLFY